MNKSDLKTQCQAAMPYYFDYLSDQHEQIPPDVCEHIANCPHCQEEVCWLEQADAASKEFSTEQLQAVSQTAQMQLHCALIDKPVTCSTVKPFLPILAMPDMSVRISTPVTAHIEACPECARDLATLTQLGLSTEQFVALSEMLTRQTNGSDNENTKLTFIQDAMMKLTAIRQITERPDSGVVTCFRGEDMSAAEPENQPAPTCTQPVKTHSPRRSRWNVRWIAAAAAIIIGAVFLFPNSTVQATDIGQIYEALKNVKYVIMTQYQAGSDEPIQKVWVSRSLGIKLFQTGDEFVLYDIKNKVQKTKADAASDVQQVDIDRITADSVAKTMEIPWGLLPFNNASALPEGAVWKKVQSDGVMTVEKIEIYDLFWSSKSIGGGHIDYQWRCHVDPASKRPFKVEWWQKNPHTQEYELTTFDEIAYPEQDQIQQVIDRAGL